MAVCLKTTFMRGCKLPSVGMAPAAGDLLSLDRRPFLLTQGLAQAAALTKGLVAAVLDAAENVGDKLKKAKGTPVTPETSRPIQSTIPLPTGNTSVPPPTSTLLPSQTTAMPMSTPQTESTSMVARTSTPMLASTSPVAQSTTPASAGAFITSPSIYHRQH